MVVSNPKENAWIAKDARKSDKVDAMKLAELLRTGLAQKHEVYYSDDPERTVFKQIVHHYDRTTLVESRLKNQLKAMLRAQGVLVTGRAVYGKAGREGL